jgi:hypothetical protein
MDTILHNRRKKFENLHFVNAKENQRLITVCCKAPWLQSAVWHASNYLWLKHVSSLHFDLEMSSASSAPWCRNGRGIESALKGSCFQWIRSFKRHREHFTPWSGRFIVWNCSEGWSSWLKGIKGRKKRMRTCCKISGIIKNWLYSLIWDFLGILRQLQI